ncbi:MAG: FAD-binding oxidoreductase [Chloroflexota bacterium]|nr:MAG: FAD-linked oxidase [Chloroflexota bacterium]
MSHTRGGFNTQFDAASLPLERLRAGLIGHIITPEDTDYEPARIGLAYKAVRRPALIVRPVDAYDVSRVVLFARETGLELAVRGGGHSMAGYGTSDGGIVLDLSSMKGLKINAEERYAWAEGGLTAGEYTAKTADYGLATGFGDTASVGLGGLTTGGGIGYLVRKYGMTIDSLLAARVVTADGQIRYTDAETEPDLFWAIRGGGGNFGVVTHFKFQLHPVDTIVGGMLMLPADPEVIAAFATLADAAPDELTTIASIMPAPPLPFVPAEHRGQLVMLAMMVYAGDVEEGLRVVEPFRKLAQPLADLLGPMPYRQIYREMDEENPFLSTLRSKFIDTIDVRTAQTMVDYLRASKSPMPIAEFRVLGGAMARVPADATAFAHRSSRIMVSFIALHEHHSETAAHTAWAAEAIAALDQGDGGAYVNFLDDEGEARLRDAYPTATRERLAAIKAKYDPTNLFHRNQNIAPKAE